MITGEIKSQIDQIWNAFWSGGISNPSRKLAVLPHQIFIKNN
jgi:type I restriction enzyme M protein